MPAHDRPSAKQQSYLRQLAQRSGTSFTPPQTKREASREIRRLKALERSPRHERDQDAKQVRQHLQGGTSAARVRDDEITGYGSDATWGIGRATGGHDDRG